MKLVKKNLKIFLLFLAFAIVSVVFAISPILTTVPMVEAANAQQMLSILQIPKVNKTVDGTRGEKLIIPLLNADTNTSVKKYTVRVYDTSNTPHDCVVDASSTEVSITNTDYFTYHKDQSQPNKASENENVNKNFTIPANSLEYKGLTKGNYGIVYFYEDEGRTYYSDRYTVSVESALYDLDFTIIDDGNPDFGKKQFVREEMKLNGEAVKLPVAYVKQKGDGSNAVIAKIAEPTMTYYNGPTDKTLTEEEQGRILVKGEDGCTFNPIKEGVYTFTYEYPNGNKPSVSKVIRVTSNYKQKDSSKFYATQPDLTSLKADNGSVKLGSTNVNLPDVHVYEEGSTAEVEHNVVNIEIYNASHPEIKKTLKNNDFTFDFTKEFFEQSSYDNMAGRWEIVYTVEDLYGNQFTKSVSLTIKDDATPEVYMAYNYEVEKADGQDAAGENLWENGKLNGKLKDAGAIVTDFATDFKKEIYLTANTDIYFPAIYATNLTSDFNEMTFVRYMVSNSGTYYIDNLERNGNQLVKVSDSNINRNAYGEGLNAEGTEDEGLKATESKNVTTGQMNKVTRFKFTKDAYDKIEDGEEFTLYYYAIAKNGQRYYIRESGSEAYKFKIYKEKSASEDAPTLTINNVTNNTSIYLEDEMLVTFTAKDSNLNDKLKTQLFYYYGSLDAESQLEAALTETNSTNYIDSMTCNILDDDTFLKNWRTKLSGGESAALYKANLNSFTDSSFKFNFDHTESKTGTVTLVMVTINDQGKIAYATRTLNIIDTSDHVAPTSTATYSGDAGWSESVSHATKKFKQAEAIALPEVTFNDASKLSLEVYYYVTDTDGNIVSSYASPESNGESIYDLTTNKIQNIQITPMRDGVYYVVYVATDMVNNSTMRYFTFTVEDDSKPQLHVEVIRPDGEEVNSEGTITAPVGTKFTFVTNATDKNGNDASSLVTFEDPKVKGTGYKIHPNSTYELTQEGDYLFTFNAKYTESGIAADSVTIKITITAPAEIQFDDLDKVSFTDAYSKGDTVFIQSVSAKLGNKNATVHPEVTVDISGGKKGQKVELTPAMQGENEGWQFTIDEENAVYHIVYVAEMDDSEDTKTSQSFDIKVGDNKEKPTITVSADSEAALTKDIEFDGTTIEYTLTLDKVNKKLFVKAVAGNKTIIDSIDLGLVLSDLDDKGVETSVSNLWNNLTFELRNADNTLSPVDENTDEGYKTYNITATGEYTIRLVTHDQTPNESLPYEIKFNVNQKAEVSHINDTVVGIVLIVISLVVLVGVILFFTFTGKKGGSKKGKNKSTKKETTETNVETDNSNDVE